MTGRSWLWLGFASSAAAYVAFLLAGGGGTYVTPPLLVAVAMAAALGGAGPGAAAGVLGWLGFTLASGADLTAGYLALVLAVVIVLADRAASELRSARTHAERRLDLLGVLLSMLRRVAAVGGGCHAGAGPLGSLEPVSGDRLRVWSRSATDPGGLRGAGPDDPPGLVEIVQGVMRTRQPFVGRAGPAAARRHATALPVLERGDVVAVVTALRREPMAEGERVLLEEFTSTLGHVLTNLHEKRSGELVLQLVQRLVGPADGATMARALLDTAVAELGLWGGAVMRYRAGRFEAQALVGGVPAGMRSFLEDGLPFGESAIWSVYQQGQALYIDDYQAGSGIRGGLLAFGVAAVAMVPLSGGPLSSVVVLLLHDAPRTWLASERSLLADLALVLRAAVEQRDAEDRLEEMGRLQRELLATPVERMYGQLLRAAVRLVPGSEAASLLERGEDGRFRFVATVGYDQAGLEPVRLTPQEMRAWYGEESGWTQGRPRVLSTAAHDSVEAASVRAAPMRPFREAGRLEEIVANLCLPVVYGGEVLAVLNLDAMQDPDAFGGGARAAASNLAPFLGFLLHEADVRRQLAAAARTDALTGLANRRAFDEQAGHDVSRAVRYREPLALLVMDLSRFKRINDRFGHAAGDEALRRVGQALRGSARAGDRLFRWGGDEFAALLAHADADVALVVADRIARAVRGVSTPAGGLAVNIGVASVPADGTELAALLDVADGRMFRAKATGKVALAGDDDID